METIPGWCLKEAAGAVPECEAEPSLFPKFPFLCDKNSQTSLEAGRLLSEPRPCLLEVWPPNLFFTRETYSLLKLPAVVTVFH